VDPRPCESLTGEPSEREREIYFKSHNFWWEHSSHFRLIGRGVPSVSVVSQLVYKFLCLASPKENPQVDKVLITIIRLMIIHKICLQSLEEITLGGDTLVLSGQQGFDDRLQN